MATVTAVWAYQARYRIPLTKALAGGRPHPWYLNATNPEP